MNMEIPNYYQILEVSPSASYDEIKKSYRKLALKHHPDKHSQTSTELVNKHHTDSVNSRFVLINEAYSTLCNPESRNRYDIQRRRGGSDYGRQRHEFSTQQEYERYRKLQLIHKLFREVMANKERLSDLGATFTKYATQYGWILNDDDDEVKPFINAYEKEITEIELSILLEPEEDLFVGGGIDYNQDLDDLTLKYIKEDDIIQILDTPHWILIDKESLITNYQMFEFVHSHRLLILAVTKIVSPLMMAVSYGSWDAEDDVVILMRVKEIQLKIIEYLQQLTQLLEEHGEVAFESIMEKIKDSQYIQKQAEELSKHPIMAKIENGRFGQNSYPLIGIAAIFGPPFAGYSFYWSIVALSLVGMISVRIDEGDLKSFRQFLELFDDITLLLMRNLE
ncbi:8916_t:CDS:2 [Ambispora gerdemannii]|uniref:8916_t:CDS:1 n=1 Tax=Ambispora gerdemannii TaxID=144530 RepID=A0A9N9AVA3_9GLOM|nr:8916_t:CDS:2 [Ambispora gerdemannii]